MWTGILLTTAIHSATLPSSFTEQTIGANWTDVNGLTFAADGRMIVWERVGRVWLVENDVKASSPLIDIREEVGAWRDHGLLGVAVHPDFLNNGYIYLLYVVDYHHLKHHGTPEYDPASNEYLRATIGRITRYTARASDNFRTVDPASRLVLLGETITTGFPILFTSHGVGSLVFGDDGTLLASCGDGASSSATDVGSTSGTYYSQALTEGIIQPKHNVGTFRAQMLSSLCGKVLRIDPITGDGIPSNPFFDAGNPRSPQSRIWALGLRNPFRLTLRPGTGSHNRVEARPGVLYIGDVGWTSWDDLNVCTGPGENFGWPLFEGFDTQSTYYSRNINNQDAPNPLYGVNGCSRQYFYFRELIKQASLAPLSWPNPCNSSEQIPDSIPVFVHARPALDWWDTARTGTFDGANAAVVELGETGCPVAGAPFSGTCSIGGVWYLGPDFPAAYRNTYFHADYSEQWIKNFVFDENNILREVRNFASSAGAVVSLGTHPLHGGLYYVSWPSTVRKVRYQIANLPPVAVAELDQNYGPTPLTVQFTGSNSRDPEGVPLSYRWDFGDGSPISTDINPVHVFEAPAGVPTGYNVSLRVTDASGATNQVSLVVSVNNTPPQVRILSPTNGATYGRGMETVYDCIAEVLDGEHGAGELACAWQTILHHNTHSHQEPVDTNCTTTKAIGPAECDGQTYYYRIVLTVTDAAGLATTNEVILFPDCTIPPSAPVAANDTYTATATLQLDVFAPGVLANDSDANDDPLTVELVSGPTNPDGRLTLNANGSFSYTNLRNAAATDMFTYRPYDGVLYGEVTTVTIRVNPRLPTLAEAVDTPQLIWRTGGNAPWGSHTSVTHDNEDAAQSGAILHSQQSWMETTVTGPGTLSFWWKVSSEPSSDRFRLYINGSERSGYRISGEVDWQFRTVELGSGTFIVRFRYDKNSSTIRGQDRAWVDQLFFGQMPPQITTQPLTQTVDAGSTAIMSVAATGTAPLSYQWHFNGSALADGGNISGATSARLTISNVRSGQAGAYTVLVRNSAGATNSAEAVLAVNPVVLLADALDAPSLNWRTSGDALWVGQSGINHDGVDAGRSGTITHEDETWLETTLTGPGVLNFWWKVSSEPSDDRLRLYINGSERLRISGEVDWEFRSIPLSSGTYTVRFRYTKDSSVSVGQDRAWVDQVQFVPPGPIAPTITRQPTNQTVAEGDTANFSVAATGTAPLSYQWRFNEAETGITTPTLILSNVQPEHAGNYSVVVSNAANSVTSVIAQLTVTPPPPPAPPEITGQPSNRSSLAGGTATFNVTATGTAPLSYQWLFNGNPLSNDATSPTLMITNVQSADAGDYSVVVTNVVGSVTSSIATLTISTAPPTIGEALENPTLDWYTYGGELWIPQTDATHDGQDAARSGAPLGVDSTLTCHVTGPATVTFWWKTVSEAGTDSYLFYLGGTVVANISGNVDWEQRTFNIPSGTQELKWKMKERGNYGPHYGWLDQVIITYP